MGISERIHAHQHVYSTCICSHECLPWVGTLIMLQVCVYEKKRGRTRRREKKKTKQLVFDFIFFFHRWNSFGIPHPVMLEEGDTHFDLVRLNQRGDYRRSNGHGKKHRALLTDVP